MDWVEINFSEIVHETDKAFLVRLKGSSEEVWVPFSVVSPEDDYESYNKGDKNGSFCVAGWFAREKGLA